MSETVVTLDVREDIRLGREPFGRIMATVEALLPGQHFRLLAPLNPVPLLSVMARKGFRNVVHQLSDDTWEVLFVPNVATAPAMEASPPAACRCGCEAERIEVDARGLEPPQPMVKILEALAGLSNGGEIVARTDRRPMHLYAHLEQRGYGGETEPQPDGSFLTRIRPKGGTR